MTSYGEPGCSLHRGEAGQRASVPQCVSKEGPWGNAKSSSQKPAVEQVQELNQWRRRRSESEETSVAGTIRTQSPCWMPHRVKRGKE